jgi:tetratricopeptide (TPR) repeat protein
MSSPCRWPSAIGVVLLLSLDTGWSQTRTAPRLDFLNDRLPIADSDLFDESSYIESGVGLSFGVDKRLTYLAGEYQEAARQFEQGVSMFKYKAEIWVYLARAYFYMKAPDRARLALERAQVLMPDLTDRLWQPLVESLLAEIRKRANNQQIQVYFYSPGQEDFLSLFRLYLFLEDYNSATGVLKSAAGRDEAYLQGDDNHRASEVTVSLGREIDRLVILTSVAPDVQEEVRIQERVDLFEALKKELESLLPQTVKAVP